MSQNRNMLNAVVRTCQNRGAFCELSTDLHFERFGEYHESGTRTNLERRDAFYGGKFKIYAKLSNYVVNILRMCISI